jgi:DNA-directed RNA polymerase subunit RPC12/RpoP
MTPVVLKVTRVAPDGPEPLSPPRSRAPLFRGTGDTDYVCGNCGSVMAAAMGPRQHVTVQNAVCSTCGAENEFPVELRN